MLNQINLEEAKYQLESLLQKLLLTEKTLLRNENQKNYKSQITLTRRRIRALEISLLLIQEKLEVNG